MTLTLFILAAVGFIAGRLAVRWSADLIPDGRRLVFGPAAPRWLAFVPGAVSAIWIVHGYLLLTGCQSVVEVQPSEPLWWNRLPFQCLFLFLLTTATLTDLLDYTISDFVVVPGTVVAIGWATISGELQIMHAWVDWTVDFVETNGQYIPDWMKQHQHLHGLFWSVCGLVTGASLMWLARVAASRLLQVPAIGFGDVTLMAMIGAFMGWQATICTLACAPFVSLVLGFGGRIVTGRSYVAFGPYLSVAAVIVIWTWQWQWEILRLKLLFSHWPTLAALLAGSFATFCLLLIATRWFLSIDATRLR